MPDPERHRCTAFLPHLMAALAGSRELPALQIDRDGTGKCAQNGQQGGRFRGRSNWRNTMSKGQLRGNREAKKPKQPKKIPPPAADLSGTTAPKTSASSPTKKK
ncbi:hypothetical protein LJ655_26215 [Paraburkholderia sp. MMS20-SJTN17]|uniref:Uncharacterized protein n=1 Tax=Paraburkholderia translucens TaxID=2886945 RepID=A0ABS8KKM0_9BURK|nr:hypothetical protein [Paraburkholderia sp. MMS20-SJTN17]MCC8405313.1 hypothetical protein [Paraburkholderia sp. MMS20-SJTN17]